VEREKRGKMGNKSGMENFSFVVFSTKRLKLLLCIRKRFNDYCQTRITMPFFAKCHAVILINDYRTFKLNDDDDVARCKSLTCALMMEHDYCI
jgi:hypothetical protein